MGILTGILPSSGGGGGAAGVPEYATYADLVAASPAPADAAKAVAGKTLYDALSGLWLPASLSGFRATLQSGYGWRKADATLGASLTLGATGTKSAGSALAVSGTGTGTPAVSGTLVAEKGLLVLRGVTGLSGGGGAAAERGWLLLRSATNNCTYSLLLPKSSSVTVQRMDGNGNVAGRSAAIASGGVVALWWDFTAATGGCGLWTPDDTGPPGSGVTVFRSDLATGGTSQFRLFPSLSGAASYSVEDCIIWSA
jgi:hypothetical protein